MKQKLGAFWRSAKGKVQKWWKHPIGFATIVLASLLFIAGIVILILSTTGKTPVFQPRTNYIVIVRHDGETQTVPTNEPDVSALLKRLDITVGARDRVEPSLDTPIVQDNFRINIYRAVPVTITDGEHTTNTYSSGATPRSSVEQAGIALYPEDEVTMEPSTDDIVTAGTLVTRLTITRAVPVTLNVYGTILSINTHDKTVAELLRDRGVKLRPNVDTVIPGPNTAITPNMQIFVNSKGTQIVTETQTIPAPQDYIDDNSLSFGTQAVRQQGSDGTEILAYQVKVVDGKEVSRTLLQTVVTVQPVPAIIARGKAVSIPADKQAVMAQAGIAESDYPYVDYIASHEGGWCPTKIQGTHDCPGYMNPDDVPSYGGYGIFQATPGRKMASAGSDWATSAVTQIRWATSYAVARYGSWQGAYNHWQSSHNW